MNVEIGTEAAQIPEKKYIIGISVCSVGFSLDAQNMLSKLSTAALILWRKPFRRFFYINIQRDCLMRQIKKNLTKGVWIFRGSNDFIVQKVYLLRLMPVCVGLNNG